MKKLFKNSKIVFAFLIISFYSCSEGNSSDESEISFNSVEKIFKMKNPFSETSKRQILKRYETVSKYYKFAIKKKEEQLENRKNQKQFLNSSFIWYRVRLTNPNHNLNTKINVRSDDYILNAAEEAGLDLPWSCRCGADSTSAAIQLSGTPVDQSEQSFLNDEQIANGWVLLDVAVPTSDSSFLTHQEENLN